ncbi:MAG: efflux RND transporter periplasmic adaptor subunit [Acidobacteria bacterium]|nr:efflux RND transporter periplasmic adaptor subunit [Acidobacteriota bacterium]
MRILLPLTAIPLILFILALAGCEQTPAKKETAAAPAPVLVQAVPVAADQWPAGYEVTGTVRARTSVAISAKVMGYVQEVRAQAGDHVREGQVLVVLDSRDLEAGYRQAEAMGQEVRDAIPEVDNAVAAAKAQLDLAKVTFSRMQDLFSKKSISSQEYDEATAKLKAAQASYQMALAKRTQIKSKIVQVDQARRAAEIMRGYAEIHAPFSGVITNKTVEPGVLATPGAPMFTVERDGSFRLEAPVEESRLPFIRVGQPVTVALDALDKTLPARVSEIVPAVDSASRSYIVKLDLPAMPNLRSGLFGRAIFPLGTRQVITVPAASVVQRGQLQSVLVVEDGVARTRLVTTGQKSKNDVEVLSGLTPGEKVISPLPEGLSDGARVEVRS